MGNNYGIDPSRIIGDVDWSFRDVEQFTPAMNTVVTIYRELTTSVYEMSCSAISDDDADEMSGAQHVSNICLEIITNESLSDADSFIRAIRDCAVWNDDMCVYEMCMYMSDTVDSLAIHHSSDDDDDKCDDIECPAEKYRTYYWDRNNVRLGVVNPGMYRGREFPYNASPYSNIPTITGEWITR